jgi:hypothetical protein
LEPIAIFRLFAESESQRDYKPYPRPFNYHSLSSPEIHASAPALVSNPQATMPHQLNSHGSSPSARLMTCQHGQPSMQAGVHSAIIFRPRRRSSKVLIFGFLSIFSQFALPPRPNPTYRQRISLGLGATPSIFSPTQFNSSRSHPLSRVGGVIIAGGGLLPISSRVFALNLAGRARRFPNSNAYAAVLASFRRQ